MAWARVLGRAAKAAYRDGLLDWAAALAFYFLLALFPAILLVAAMLGTFHMSGLAHTIVAAVGRDLPQHASALVTQSMDGLLARHVPGLFSFGIVLALYSASQGFYGLMTALNVAYEVPETRPYWRRMLLAVALTGSVGIAVAVALTTVVLGQRVLTLVAGPPQAGFALSWLWPLIRWGITFAAMTLAVVMLYRFAPNLKHDSAGVLPAAVSALALWTVASALLASYVNNFGAYTRIYGSLGAVIALMLWFYVFALAILLGAEIHHERLRDRGIRTEVKFRRAVGSQRAA